MAVAVAWTLLAISHPTVTFHLGPVLVAAAWPVGLRRGAAVRVASADALRGALGGLLVTAVAAFVLVALDAMRGPTLWGSGHAVVEVIPAALAGVVGGYRHARCSPV